MDLLCKAHLLSWTSSLHPCFCYWGVYFHWSVSFQLGLSLHQGLPGVQQRPADKAVSPEERLLRVHAPCLGCARGCRGWRWVTVGAPPHPLGKARSPPHGPSALAELFQKIASFFLSAIANVLVSQGSRTEISPLPAFAGSSPGRRTSTAFLLQTKPQGEIPSPSLWRAPAPAAVGPWVAGKGPRSPRGRAGAARGHRCVPVGVVPVPSCGNWENIRGKYVGAGLGAEAGNPPVGAGWSAGLSPRVCAVPSPPDCCPSAVFIAIINRG